MGRFASFAALVFLAACSTPALLVRSQSSGLDVIPGVMAPVAASDRVNSNQAFSKTWQVKKSASAGGASVVEEIKMNIPGRVFVSYVEDASSGDSLAEVIVSGSSEAAVKLVDVFGIWRGSGFSMQAFGDINSVEDSAFLLTEVKLHQKRTVKKINPSGFGDVVILENVLFTKSKEDFEAAQAASTATTSTSSGFKLTEMAPTEGGRQWNITATDKNVAINFDISFPGTMDFWSLEESATPDTIAVIRLNEQMAGFGSTPSHLSKIPVEQLEIEHTHASDSEDLLLRVKPTFNAKGKDLNVWAIIELHPSMRANVVHSDVERLTDTRFLNVTDGFDVFMLMEGNGSVYISDKDASLFLDGADIGGISGNLQVDVGELSVSSMIVSLISAGEVNIFADKISTSSPITASLGDANVCLSSSNDLQVTQLDVTKASQVSYTGKANARKCVKRDLPERVPGKVVVYRYEDDSSSSASSSFPSSRSKSTWTSSSSGSGETKTATSAAATTVKHSMGVTALGIAAAAAVSLLKEVLMQNTILQQVFAKAWQINGNAAQNITFIDSIRLNVPGRVFITYTESSSAGAIGEVKVSGSSESIVQAIDVVSNTTAGGPKLFSVKNRLKDMLTKGSADMMILENVLYMRPDVDLRNADGRRRLGDSMGLVLEERYIQLNDDPQTVSKSYFIKPASGNANDIHSIDLPFGVPGSVGIAQMDPEFHDGAYVGCIHILENLPRPGASSSIDQVSVVLSHNTSSEEIKFQSTPEFSPNSGSTYFFFVGIVPFVKVTTIGNASSVEISNEFDQSYNDRIVVLAAGTEAVFVSDKTLAVNTGSVTFNTTGAANVQVDVADFATDILMDLGVDGSGNISLIGENLNASVVASVRGDGKICTAPNEEPSVRLQLQTASSQVSYTGKENAFACTTLELPKRVPSKIGASEEAPAGKSAKETADSDKGAKSTSSSSAGSIVLQRGLLSSVVVGVFITVALLTVG